MRLHKAVSDPVVSQKAPNPDTLNVPGEDRADVGSQLLTLLRRLLFKQTALLLGRLFGLENGGRQAVTDVIANLA